MLGVVVSWECNVGGWVGRGWGWGGLLVEGGGVGCGCELGMWGEGWVGGGWAWR